MKNFLLIILVCLFSFTGFSQKLSLDLYGGVTNYQGDLQQKTFTLKRSHLAGALGLTYSLDEHYAIRSSFMLGKISGDDQFTRNKFRNLNFTSQIAEFQLALQYYVFSLDDEERKFKPYAFAGAALFHYNPYTHDAAGTKYYLKPLSTEGQGFIPGKKNYKLTQISIPFGAGVKYPLSETVNIGAEIGFRKTFTDYLDDVSTVYVDPSLLEAFRGAKAVELASRGGEISPNPWYHNKYPTGATRGHLRKDWYYFTGLTISYRFPEGGGRRRIRTGGRL